ncbi:MAG: flagellar basal body L-ring protein FlgH [Stygiobacter sp.]|jgi:flagellar L-ring protein precursor FlgH|uniref:Flagellar L-ring protein n=1 Tax=Stygiobacter electus TaxID=3032292 RepID=A0AAE3TBF3_9BACT|nr:flagellar basal body L-ring protein FlgH [Stygiobacter electus]MDF1611233.1 flagellar basal body L-ring protein FlgH [Stygiobacter electus]
MKKFLLISLLINASIFSQVMRKNSQFSLFSDNKAAMPGDAVTIIVIESTQASNSSQTSSGRTSDLGLSASGTVGTSSVPKTDISLGTKNDFKGSGTTSTNGMIRTKISAVVDTVLANGNLVIHGSKKISINGEDQIVNIKGVVRPIDIMPDNSVYSYNISDAEITFEGSGLIDSSQKPGWLTKLFHWLF